MFSDPPFCVTHQSNRHTLPVLQEELAQSITAEQGKTLADARGDVFRGLEVVEFACGMTSQLSGDMVRVHTCLV